MESDRDAPLEADNAKALSQVVPAGAALGTRSALAVRRDPLRVGECPRRAARVGDGVVKLEEIGPRLG
jgi:hypothetical protein